MGQQPSEEKKEGVAEAAPKTPGLLPTNPVLPAPKGRRKRWKLFEMDGYFRLRTNWFKNFHLGFRDDLAGGAPFPRSLGCGARDGGVLGAPCEENLSSTTMRLRLEPTFNLDEGTSIHVQADVLDNLVLGSTPTGLLPGYDASDITNRPPVGAFGNTQEPPLAGINSNTDSISIKRAWAEVAVPLGILQFGRMPNHWGMGIFSNAGGYDPVHGTYDLDADYGDSVDRFSFSAIIPGTNLRAMIATNWDSTRLVSNQTPQGYGRELQPWDLADEDDSTSWIGVISRMDSPTEFRDKVDRGELAINYGVYFEYKNQHWDNDISGFQAGQPFDAVARFVPRELKTYTPNPWVRLAYKRIELEAEFVAQLGSVDRLDEFGLQGADIRKYGGAGRFTWKGLEGKLRLGIESGFASGDQWDNVIPGDIHFTRANLLGDPSGPRDSKLSQFVFNRAYNVDLILFRQLIGAVTNAGYVKPFLSYELTRSIGFRVANITSFAMKPVATPGNERMMGTEFDGELGYNSNGLFAGISYGVLFPFAAMNHPVDDIATGEVFGFDPENTGDAGTAHTIQMKLILKF